MVEMKDSGSWQVWIAQPGHVLSAWGGQDFQSSTRLKNLPGITHNSKRDYALRIYPTILVSIPRLMQHFELSYPVMSKYQTGLVFVLVPGTQWGIQNTGTGGNPDQIRFDAS